MPALGRALWLQLELADVDLERSAQHVWAERSPHHHSPAEDFLGNGPVVSRGAPLKLGKLECQGLSTDRQLGFKTTSALIHNSPRL